MKRSIVAFYALFAAGIVFSAGRGYSAEYFVDSFSGADSASGTSPESAWKSLQRVNDAKLAPGDVVRFRRGRVWRGKLQARSGAEGRPVVYSSYGEGAKPRIMQSVDLNDPNLWERVGDSSIWATEAPAWQEASSSAETLRFAQGDWHVYCEENARAKLERKVFGRPAYSLHCEESDEKGTYLQFTVNSFPVRANRNVAFRFRARSSKPFVIDSGSARVFMTNKPWTSYADTIEANCQIDGEWREFQIVFNTKVDADDARLTFFLGSILPDGATFDFIPLEACDVESTGVVLPRDVGNVVFTKKYADEAIAVVEPATKTFVPTYDKREYAGFKRWTFDDLKAPGDFWSDLKSRRLYVYSETNPGATFESVEAVLREHCCLCAASDVVIENIAFTHTAAHGISSPKSSRVVIRDCDFDWIGGGDLASEGGEGRRVRFGNGVEFWDGSVDCVVERCRFSRVYDVAITTQGPEVDVSKNLIMRDNVMFRCEQAFEIWFTNKETVVEGLVFERNLCVSCGRDWSHVQRPDKTATAILGYNLDAKKVDITIRQNVFCDTAQFFVKCWHNRVDEYLIDDNVYWVYPETPERPLYSGDKFFCFGASQGKAPLSFDEFRATTKHDKHSRWLEPKFRDFDKDDFTLLNRAELGAGPQE